MWEKTWQIINEVTNRKVKSNIIADEIAFDGNTFVGKTEIAKGFNDFFTDIGPSLAGKIQHSDQTHASYLPPKQPYKFGVSQINKWELDKIVKSIQNKSSSGYDGMSNKLLKEIYDSIHAPLLHVINLSITKGVFPDEWKIAKIVPIYKKGSKNEGTNYRPVSLLPTLSKIIEKVVDKQIRDFLESNNLIYSNQYGFRKGHETQHALLKFNNLICEGRSKKLTTIAIFADLKKAFDTVDHSILLDKIDHLGIDNKWLRSYLENRKQFTQIHNTKSNNRIISTGVPQGSILGPLLFLIYINDFPSSTDFITLQFADDTTLLMQGKEELNFVENINYELRKVKKWFDTNYLTLHPEKTNFIIFDSKNGNNYNNKIKIDNHKLSRIGEDMEQKTTKFVGLIIDENLKWNHHISDVSKKIAVNAHYITTNKNFFPKKIKILLYNALIRPFLEYGINIWGFGKTKNIFTQQKRIIRAINNCKNYRAHTSKMFSENNILKFNDLRDLNVLKLIRNILNNQTPLEVRNTFHIKETQNYLRNCNKTVLEPKYKSKLKKNNLQEVLVKVWNESDEQIRSLTRISNLKKNLQTLNLWNTLKLPAHMGVTAANNSFF